VLLPDVAVDPSKVPCPLDWQPSVFAPVFYGVREYEVLFHLDQEVAPVSLLTAGFGNKAVATLTARFLIFFPSLDGSPLDAPILDGCGRYPLVVFAHGQCGEEDHFRKWYELPATLARCGYVVVVPHLPNTNSGTFPSQNDEEVVLLRRLIAWARTDWEHKNLIMPDPATGLVGHSFGAALTGRVISEGGIPITAHASLSGTYPAALKQVSMPKLLTWGTGGENNLVPIVDWETQLASPAHVVEFHGAGHWDYLPQGRSTCTGVLGECRMVPVLAADVVALFLGRYMPPEHWVELGLPSWLPWFRVPRSLSPPPLLLTQEQKFFAGGHFSAWPLLDDRPECGVTLNWKTLGGSGSLVKD
jgi:pimeloyl-ACP methyl ester carboxylesterase